MLRLRCGEERAFEELYRIYSARIYRSILNMVKDKEVASELLQDVFIKVWEKREVIDADNSFRSYMFTIARNMVYNYLKKSSLEMQMTAYMAATKSEFYTHVEENVLHKEIEDSLNTAIDMLPPQRKKIFILCKIEGKSYEEVSKLLGISMATVNDHIVKATHFLKHQLKDVSQTYMVLLFTFLDF